MNINLLAVTLATIAQFIVGAVWYSLIFGKLWGRIHGFDKLSKEVQKEMMSKMGPLYGGQLIVTIFISVVLAYLIKFMPEKSPYLLAFMVWIGFVIPTQYSDVIFGGTDSKWIIKKLAVLAGASLACLMVAAALLNAFK
jgi:tetrahydromethanopterin S-methyltransferase subunit E